VTRVAVLALVAGLALEPGCYASHYDWDGTGCELASIDEGGMPVGWGVHSSCGCGAVCDTPGRVLSEFCPAFDDDGCDTVSVAPCYRSGCAGEICDEHRLASACRELRGELAGCLGRASCEPVHGHCEFVPDSPECASELAPPGDIGP
jgi:hypothetical protein